VGHPVQLGSGTSPQFRPNPHVGAPNYGGVKFIGRVYEILGWVCCILGVVVFALCLLGGLAGGADTGYSSASRARGAVLGGLGGGLMGAIFGGMLILAGVIQIGMGQLFYCMRDLARNSFHLQRL